MESFPSHTLLQAKPELLHTVLLSQATENAALTSPAMAFLITIFS